MSQRAQHRESLKMEQGSDDSRDEVSPGLASASPLVCFGCYRHVHTYGEDDEELLALEAEFKHKCFYDRDDTKQGASRKIMGIEWDPNSDNGSGGTGQWIAHTERCDKLGKMCKQKRPEPYGMTVEGWADNMRDMITEFETRKKRMRKPK